MDRNSDSENSENDKLIEQEIESFTEDESPSTSAKAGSAVFYAISSILIVFINKSVLSIYSFPSPELLGCGQMTAAIIVLTFLKLIKKIDFPDHSLKVIKEIFPLPLLYLANMIFGLMSTQSLSLPMFTVLRRFSILMTMILEWFILKNEARRPIIVSIAIMIGGALVAALDDLAFDVAAYCFILLNDFFTASYGVFTKKKLNGKDLGKYGLMYYNSLCSLPLVLLISYSKGDFEKIASFSEWANPMFIIQFVASCFMGFILMYSIILCTQNNSSLTTTVVGCMKNLFVTYFGMMFGHDYKFSMLNFVGINISVAGSLVYSYFAFKKPKESSQTQPLLKR